MEADRFLTHSLRDPRATRVLAAALDAAEPGRIVREYLQRAALPAHERLFLLGIGKAAEPMTLAAAEALGHFAEACVVTKHAFSRTFERATVMEAGHPLPDARSLAAGEAVLDFISRLDRNDLLICLLSGGGSSLATAPCQGVSLEELQTLTSSLLASGATIAEMNLLRRRLDRLKGGGLAQATKAQILSLILSDVIGDRPEEIASGPTALDTTIGEEGISILQKYKITPPDSILRSLRSTPSMFDRSRFDHVHNAIVGSNRVAVRAAQHEAQSEGFDSEIISTEIQGEASQAGRQLADRLKAALKNQRRPFCLLAGGETTVTIKGSGRGGRNQELALGAVEPLSGSKEAMLIALASDGDDGPTDAAGAVVTGETRQRAEKLRMSAADYLSRNDAYSFFEALQDLLKPGYTGTNVNDLIFLFGF